MIHLLNQPLFEMLQGFFVEIASPTNVKVIRINDSD